MYLHTWQLTWAFRATLFCLYFAVSWVCFASSMFTCCSSFSFCNNLTIYWEGIYVHIHMDCSMQQGQLKCVIDCTTKCACIIVFVFVMWCSLYIDVQYTWIFTSDSSDTVFDTSISRTSNCSASSFFSFSSLATYKEISQSTVSQDTAVPDCHGVCILPLQLEIHFLLSISRLYITTHVKTKLCRMLHTGAKEQSTCQLLACHEDDSNWVMVTV